MSRSGYSDDCEDLNLYRATVRRAVRGKRGQVALRDLIKAFDAMPEKKLVSRSFSCEDGVCSLGALALSRNINMSDFEAGADEYNAYDRDGIGERLNIAPSMAAEVMYENDESGGHYTVGEGWSNETPEERWTRMRSWAVANLKDDD